MNDPAAGPEHGALRLSPYQPGLGRVVDGPSTTLQRGDAVLDWRPAD